MIRIARTCTKVTENLQRFQTTLAENKDVAAYVLLGEPGSGKTFEFENEAQNIPDAHYVKARDFLSEFLLHQHNANKIYFIDGLDELRVGEKSGRGPLDHIRLELLKLGEPKFRLSCREADWLGSSDVAALTKVSQDRSITVLHLNPLTHADIHAYLISFGIGDPDTFIQKADNLNLDVLLTNPQTLNLLIDAVKNSAWPETRTEVYKLACLQLIKEGNKEHRDAEKNLYTNQEILNAAGYACAILLLSGIYGFAMDSDQEDSQHTTLGILQFSNTSLLTKALKSNLFKADGPERRVPIHRSVAEFLAGKYLSNQIEEEGLPIGRILSLMCGYDGGLVSDLRGLAAWLSVHSTKARYAFIERDPLAIILYGDTIFYSEADKKFILEVLRKEVIQNPWVRSGEWIAHPFGGLATKEMEAPLTKIINDSESSDADQALLNCVLDALEFGTISFSEELINTLYYLILKTDFWPVNRIKSLQLLLKNLEISFPKIVDLTNQIIQGALEDRDDELLGTALKSLYPTHIPATSIFEYLHPLKDIDLIGTYLTFWEHNLAKQSSKSEVAYLLDHLAAYKNKYRNYFTRYQSSAMYGNLLIKGLVLCGEEISKERLYGWLSVGLDKYSHQELDKKQADVIAEWFKKHPERYLDVVSVWTDLCVSEVEARLSYQLQDRLYGAEPPNDLDLWYLRKSVESSNLDVANELFQNAFIHSIYRAPTKLRDLEFYEKFVEDNPKFRKRYEDLTFSIIPEWRKEQHQSQSKYRIDLDERKREWIAYIGKNKDSISDGTAPAHILHNLALAYNGLLIEAHGDTPLERLSNFLNGDSELIEAALSGFKKSIYRNDLPEVQEILDLNKEGRMHYIRTSCLLGIKLEYDKNNLILESINDELLKKLTAFQLTYDVGNDPDWFKNLYINKPLIFSSIFEDYVIPLVKLGKEHISSVYGLAHNEDLKEVARLSVPKILNNLPLRVKAKTLNNIVDPLLRSALLNLSKDEFIKIIETKLAHKSLDNAQKTYWYGCALLLEPKKYAKEVLDFIGTSQTKSNYLGSFLYTRYGKSQLYETLPSNVLGMLIEILAPGLNSQRPRGAHWVSPLHEKSDLVSALINILANNTSTETTSILSKLVSLPKLSEWKSNLQRALHSQKIARRKSTFQHISLEKIIETLKNKEPSSAADLWALANDQIKDLSLQIRNANTNSYQQFWNVDSRGAVTMPIPENECRNRFLVLLRERLSKFRIDAQPESYYADDKRADIRLSYAGFSVPIEIKVDRHPKLWTAISDQLIPKYIRDPDCDGYGIYIVFWFGGKDSPLPPNGKRPQSASELELRLIDSLDDDVKSRVGVNVIDVSVV